MVWDPIDPCQWAWAGQFDLHGYVLGDPSLTTTIRVIVQQAYYGPYLDAVLSTSEARPGQAVTATVTGFLPGERVTATLYGNGGFSPYDRNQPTFPQGSCIAGPDGRCSIRMTAPANPDDYGPDYSGEISGGISSWYTDHLLVSLSPQSSQPPRLLPDDRLTVAAIGPIDPVTIPRGTLALNPPEPTGGPYPAGYAVTMSDGSTQTRDIVWPQIKPADLARPGTITVRGLLTERVPGENSLGLIPTYVINVVPQSGEPTDAGATARTLSVPSQPTCPGPWAAAGLPGPAPSPTGTGTAAAPTPLPQTGAGRMTAPLVGVAGALVAGGVLVLVLRVRAAGRPGRLMRHAG